MDVCVGRGAYGINIRFTHALSLVRRICDANKASPEISLPIVVGSRQRFKAR